MRDESHNPSSEAPCPVAKARREAVEKGFGERVRALIQGRAEFTAVARRALGMKRGKLYKSLDGIAPFPAAWLELLPADIELAYLAERAAAHALRLMPVVTSETTLMEVMIHVGAMLHSCGESERDGLIQAWEAERDLKVLRPLLVKILELIAQRERALIEPGGLVVDGCSGGPRR